MPRRLVTLTLPEDLVRRLDAYGNEQHDGHGARLVHFTKQARRRLEREVGREPVRRMHEYVNAYAVYGTDGTLITTGHRYQRIHRKQ